MTLRSQYLIIRDQVWIDLLLRGLPWHLTGVIEPPLAGRPLAGVVMVGEAGLTKLLSPCVVLFSCRSLRVAALPRAGGGHHAAHALPEGPGVRQWLHAAGTSLLLQWQAVISIHRDGPLQAGPPRGLHVQVPGTTTRHRGRHAFCLPARLLACLSVCLHIYLSTYLPGSLLWCDLPGPASCLLPLASLVFRCGACNG